MKKKPTWSRPSLYSSDVFYGNSGSSASQWLQHYDTKLSDHTYTPKQYLTWLQVLLAGDAKAWAETLPAAGLLAERKPTQQTIISFISLLCTQFPEQPVIPEQPMPVLPKQPIPEQPMPEQSMPEQPVPVLPEQPVPEQPFISMPVTPKQPIPVLSEQPVPEQPVPAIPEQPVLPKQPIPVLSEQPIPEQSMPAIPKQPVLPEQPVPAVSLHQSISQLPEQPMQQASLTSQLSKQLHIGLNQGLTSQLSQPPQLYYTIPDPLHYWIRLAMGVG